MCDKHKIDKLNIGLFLLLPGTAWAESEREVYSSMNVYNCKMVREIGK